MSPQFQCRQPLLAAVTGYSLVKTDQSKNYTNYFLIGWKWLQKKILTSDWTIKYIWNQDFNCTICIQGTTQLHSVISISKSKRRGTASDESQTSDESAKAIFFH